MGVATARALVINGDRRGGPDSVPVIDPSTGSTFAEAPLGGLGEVEDAIAAARAAFDEGPWGAAGPAERSRALGVVAATIEADRDHHVETMIAESGAPRLQAGFMVQLALDYLRWCAEMAGRDFAESLPPNVTPMGPGASILGARTKLREPVGVVAAFAPFNSCFVLAAVKLGSALAMGNTVILKPSPETPLGVLDLGAAALAADLPPGVVNVVTGELGVARTLVSDPRVDMISFTGSDTVGADIMAQAAPTLKRVLLELGGKSALVIRADADLDLAVRIGTENLTFMAGQGCALQTRHLVHADIHDSYLAGLRESVEALTVGDPGAEGTVIGPLISAGQLGRVERMTEKAVHDGATVECGGGRAEHLGAGYFFEPTVLAGVDNRSEIAQDEVFGPVVTVTSVRDDETAVELANESRYGLSGGIVTADTGRGWELARRMRTGEVLLNGGAGMMSPWAPFGGYKRSGIGREYGVEGLAEYAQVKTVLYQAR